MNYYRTIPVRARNKIYNNEYKYLNKVRNYVLLL